MDIKKMTGEEYYGYFKLCASCARCVGLSEDGQRKCFYRGQESIGHVRGFCAAYVHDPQFKLTDEKGNYIGNTHNTSSLDPDILKDDSYGADIYELDDYKPGMYDSDDYKPDDYEPEEELQQTELFIPKFKFTSTYDTFGMKGALAHLDPYEEERTPEPTTKISGLGKKLREPFVGKGNDTQVTIPESALETGAEYIPDMPEKERGSGAALSIKAIALIIVACVVAVVAAAMLLPKALEGMKTEPHTPVARTDVYSDEQQSTVFSKTNKKDKDENKDKNKDKKDKTKPSPSPSPSQSPDAKKLSNRLNGTWVRYSREKEENTIDVEELTFNSADGTYTLSKYTYLNDMFYGQMPEGEDIWYILSMNGNAKTVHGMFTASDSGELVTTGDQVKTSHINMSGDELYIDGLMYASSKKVSGLSDASDVFDFDLDAVEGKFGELGKKLDGKWVNASRNGDSISVTIFEFNYSGGKYTRTDTIYTNKALHPESKDRTDSDGWYAPADAQSAASGTYFVSGASEITLDRSSSGGGSTLGFELSDSHTMYLNGVCFISGMYAASIRELSSYFGFSADAPRKTPAMADVYKTQAAGGESYWLMDMDGNGVTELIVLTGGQLVVYTYTDNALCCLGSASAENCDIYGNSNGGLVLVYTLGSTQSVRNVTVSGGSVIESVTMDLQEVEEYTVPDNAYAIAPHSPSDLSAIDNIE